MKDKKPVFPKQQQCPFYLIHILLLFSRLSEAAVAKFEQIKEQSATGLQHAIEQRKYTEISVDLQPSYVIIPDKGYYTK